MFIYYISRIILLFSILITGLANAQSSYRYSVDLTKLSDDKLQVELLTPKVSGNTVVFSFPKIIPGTYMISDYGKFISDVKAFDKVGKALPVAKQGDNQWKITNAARLAGITYVVEDIFDTEIKHIVYPMAATDFEEGKAFVLHTPGMFGFIDGMNKLPFEVTITKPADFFGSTALKPVSTSAGQDIFQTKNVDELYDAPIMYSKPDTTTVRVGNTDVLVSVYSPNGKLKSKEIAGWMSELLDATKNYLGGKLPADRYAFLYYFHNDAKHSFPAGLGGALEHTTSSFYYLPELAPERIKNNLVDISSHEFFHIITPLNISSKEVKEFNFNEAVLSKHLWLYEGVTEYSSDHVQVKYGMITPQQFLDRLSQKISNSRKQYNDKLPFTELSKESAGKHKDEYGNVYEKGALIAATLDVYLLHLSDGAYGLRNLTYDLGVRYGRDRYFNDDELFDEIAKLSYPEVKDFFVKYVAGPNPIPYDYYFGLAGIKFSESDKNKLEFMPQPSDKQKAVGKGWMTAKQSESAKQYTATLSDVASIEAIVKATYAVISGPAGNRDWNRFHSLFQPGAKMGATVQTSSGNSFRSFTPQEYQQNNNPVFLKSGFFEEALGMTVTQYRNIAHVQSAYQYRFTQGGKIEQRGVNYFTLVNSGGRWWIANLVWQDEDAQNPIPQGLLKAN